MGVLVYAFAAGSTWAEKLTAIGTVVIAGGVLIAAAGAWLAWNQLRETRRDRASELISNFGARWDEPRLFNARAKRRELGRDGVLEAVRAWLADRSDPESPVPEILQVPNYFEDLAIMAEFGSYDLRLVAKGFSGLAFWEWDYWAESIEEIRQNLDAQAYVEFERLVNDLKALEASD